MAITGLRGGSCKASGIDGFRAIRSAASSLLEVIQADWELCHWGNVGSCTMQDIFLQLLSEARLWSTEHRWLG